ncbi:hypothetical protein [Lactococcus taiwanensis]|uniref:hypothetical protein n=1 Tax=Lactococcus taiwanensis TaxID=1151742 RepID=UPI0007B221F9|nr:DNA topology modulation protein FLAR-related protein [Lactococcus cremoris]
MKIYIVGMVGSGKSTLARQLGDLLDVPVFHLDNVVHDGDRKRSEQDNFIIEDTLRDRFTSLLTV